MLKDVYLSSRHSLRKPYHSILTLCLIDHHPFKVTLSNMHSNYENYSADLIKKDLTVNLLFLVGQIK